MRISLKKHSLAFALVLTPLIAGAIESTSQAADKTQYSFNPVLVGLVCLILVLLFAIGLIANVMRQLTFVYREKIQNERESSSKTDITKATLLILALSVPALSAIAGTADSTQVAAPVSTVINGIPKDDYYMLMTIIGLEIIVIITLVLNVRLLISLISRRPELAPLAKAIVRRSFWDRFNNRVSIEKEAEIMLDHDYDGIHELDNSLPPWWKYGFYLTILVSIIYIYRYHVSHTGQSQEEEYAAEMQQAAAEQAAYLANAANNVNENTIKLLTDPNDLAAGKQIFESTCFACHAKDGGGGVGPNLTDDYWLHGGSIKDVFKSIKYGWQDKGMKSWQNDFSAKQIAQIASYVKSLHGTKPAAPKDKQGEIYIEGNTTKDTTSAENKVAKN